MSECMSNYFIIRYLHICFTIIKLSERASVHNSENLRIIVEPCSIAVAS